MSFGGIQLTLMVGSVVPSVAPASFVNAVRRIQVTRSDEGPSGFQIDFQLVRGAGAQDYDLLNTLKPFHRIVIVASVGGVPNVLMDGLITHRQVTPGTGGQSDTVSVTGEDVSVAMDLIELTLPYPSMIDSVIVAFVLLKYAVYGVIPMIIPTEFSISTVALEVVTQQSATDRAFLNDLACRHGYVFQIIPGPSALMNTAYFGPPLRIGMPQQTLTVNELPATNVESINFSYQALPPYQRIGYVQDTLETDLDVPVVPMGYTRIPPLATQSAFLTNAPFLRFREFSGPGLDPIQAYAQAWGEANRSADDTVSVTGTVDTFRYQSVLAAPGLVALRGAGLSHDGLYYVKSVTHELTPQSYKQQFTLTREGLGSLLATVSP